jgi:glyoxylase-like metal-dependent hydrolase (beta-lactamase superfamily II)
MTSQPFAVDLFEPDQEEHALLRASGFVRVPLALPWPIEPVNVTIVFGETIALIDGGLRYLDNLDRLEAALLREGVSFADIGAIWLTHPHVDHFGLVEEVVARSGAEVFAFSGAERRFHEYMTCWQEDRDWVHPTLAACGVPEQVMHTLRNRPSFYRDMGGQVALQGTFDAGDTVSIAGLSAEVLHVPGHSPWCTAFWFAEQGVLVSGDALLGRITSNPILYPPDAAPEGWQGIVAYRRSLETMAALDAVGVLPGPGRSFRDHQRVVELALRNQSRRKERIATLLQEGCHVPFVLAQTLFGAKRAEAGAFLVMSEVLRHLDWLCSEQRAKRIQSNDSWRYLPI